MFSIYSSFYNVHRMGFDWRGALSNWLTFLGGTGQISLVINTSDDNSANMIREYLVRFQQENLHNRTKIKVVDAAIPYTDPEFDGKLKALALEGCEEPYAILLDCDERLVPGSRSHWVKLTKELERNYNIDAILIPVVDIFHDDKHWKSVGAKWYLHRNLANLTRGVVKWGYREDGSIDVTKSDTCELKYRDSGELVRAAPLLMPGLPPHMQVAQLEAGETPFVHHLGWKDKQQRLRQSAFWQPVWSARDGKEVKTESTLEELEKIQYYRHHLPHWEERR